MPALDDVLQEELAALEQAGRRRSLRQLPHCLSFCGNDYLGLSQHPAVIEAATEATEKYGTGAGASRLVSGNHPLYGELESLLAEMKGTEAACVFGSGYMANLGVISTLMGKQDLILFDRLAHASLIDGIQLSGATWLRFKHNDAADCARLLKAARPQHRHCLIVTETVFSMDGDAAPIATLAEIAGINDAWLLVDSAHGASFFCSPASPTARQMERSSRLGRPAGLPSCLPPARAPSPIAHRSSLIPLIQIGTLSKAVGSYGGYVCGSQTLIDYLHTAARPFIYSTGLPPAAVAASIAALKIIREDKALCALPLARAALFCDLLGLPAPQSAIVPLILGEEQRALDASKRLEEAGFLVAAIRPPTVPPGTARLRFTFSALHREEDVERLAALVRIAGWHRRGRAA